MISKVLMTIAIILAVSLGIAPAIPGVDAPTAALAQDYDDGGYTGEGEDDNEPRDDGRGYEDSEPGEGSRGKSNRRTRRDMIDCANRRCRQYCQGNFCATPEYNECANSCE